MVPAPLQAARRTGSRARDKAARKRLFKKDGMNL